MPDDNTTPNAAAPTAPTAPTAAPAPVESGDDAQRAELAGMYAAEEERASAGRDGASAVDDVDAAPAGEEVQGTDGDQAEPKDPPKPEPEKPKENESKLFKSALALRDEANGKFEEVKRERAVFESERTRFEADRTAFETERAKFANIRRDPFSAFDLLGFTPQDLGKWLIEEPEQKAERLRNEDANASRSKVDDETKRELAELKAWKEQQEAERVNRAVADSRGAFVKLVEANTDKYPDIADEPEEELKEVMWDLATQHYENTRPRDARGQLVLDSSGKPLPGQVASLEAIAEHMQNAAAEKRLKREERKKGRSTQPASVQSSESPTTQRQQGQPASPGPRSAPTTLSNGAATERASSPRELTKEELDRECAKELAGLWG